MAFNVGTAVAYLELDSSKFTNGFKAAATSLKTFTNQTATVGDKVKSVGTAFTSVGSSLTKTLTVPIAGIGVAAIKAGSDFESAMSQVAATMGKPKSEIQDLTKFAQEMGAKTVFSATEAANGLNILAMSGLDAKEQMAALPNVLNLAAAGAISLEDAASYTTGTVKGFSDTMDHAQYYVDIMAKGATLAQTDVRGLGEAMSTAAATSAGYGQTAQSTALSLMRLAEQGKTGSEAATMLSRAMMDIYTPTADAATALDELGVSAYDAEGNTRDFNDIVEDLNNALSGMTAEQKNAYKNTIFTTHGMDAFNKMTVTSVDKVKEWDEALSSASDELDGQGSAALQAQIQLDNLKGSLTLLGSALEGAGIAISNSLIPYIRQLTDWITSLVTKFNELTPQQQDQIVKIGLIVAAIGPLLIIIGRVIGLIGTAITVIGTIASVLTTILNPIGLIVIAIGSLIAVFVHLFNTNEEFRNKVIEIWNSVVSFVQSAVQAISDVITVWFPFIFQFIVGVLQSIFNSIVSTIANVINAVTTWASNMVQKAVEVGTNFLSSIVQFFTQLPGTIWGFITSAYSRVVSWGNQMITSARTTASNFLTSIVQYFTQLPSRILAFITNALTNVTNWSGQMAQKAKETGSKFLTNIIQDIQKVPERIMSYIRQIPSKILGVGGNMRSAGTSIMNRLLDGIKSVSSSIISFASSVASRISSIFSGIGSAISGAVGRISGHHANGLDYVPYNGYVAQLHEGERVLTKQQNKEYKEGRSSGGDVYNFYNTKPNAYEYARQMKKAKRELLYGF